MTNELIPAPRLPRPLLPRIERFRPTARGRDGDAVRAYEVTHRKKGATSRHGMRSNAHRLAHSPPVAARGPRAPGRDCQDAVVAVKARAAWLQSICEADVREIVRIVADPCAECWPPDSHETQPNSACRKCRGEGTQRVIITPTDELSAAARALLKSIRQKADGSIEVRLHDPLVAADMLNRMQGVYVERSVNVNLNVPALETMTREQQLEFLNSLKPAT